MNRLPLLLAPLLLALLGLPAVDANAASSLLDLTYRVVGAQLRPFPESLSVPRNVQGSIQVAFAAGTTPIEDPNREAAAGTRIEATLRGPSLPAQRLVAQYGDPLILPPLRIVGDYQLEDIRLLQGSNIVLRASPSTVPVRVFDEVLVSRVTSRPLTLEEIRDKGIAIDESSFRVVEFDVTLALRGRSFRVTLPVAAPAARLSTEIIPATELEDRRVELDRLNRELGRSVEIPPEIQAEIPDFTLNPIQFEEVLDAEEPEKRSIPITGLLVIPGDIGFLNQFFSIQLFTENAAPADSGLVVNHLRAVMRLPNGPDGIPGPSHDQPGDDPLRMARLGPDRLILTNLPVTLPGNDQQPGTADDVLRIRPGETGSAEFLVEGLREGLHLLEIDLEADLEGFAAGPTRIRGRASGSVLVRNARFSMSFTHPRTVRSGEPYEASVTLLNTGDTVANLTRVSLSKLALSGAVLLTDERVELGDLAPGESATATFRFRSQRTGSVYFSNLTTSEDSVRGRLNLIAGVDERGVALSPDSIGYPAWVDALPLDLFTAANRVLGQALSVATAARLPTGVRKLPASLVEQRVIELAEAGQRLRYGDDPRRVLLDLALDWQGGRRPDPGFDQLLRETHAGREWAIALSQSLESRDAQQAPERLADLAPNLAGLSQTWWIASSSHPTLPLSAQLAGPMQPRVSVDENTLPQAMLYPGLRGLTLVAQPHTNLVFTAQATARIQSPRFGFLEFDASGQGERLEWQLPPLDPGDTVVFQPSESPRLTWVHGDSRTELAPNRTPVTEEPPRVISVRQDIQIESDRDFMRCPIREYGNWGTVLAVLYSKPMDAEGTELPQLYQLPDGNGARTVKLQPGGRVALLQLHRGIASFSERPRDYLLSLASAPDPRGHLSTPTQIPVLTTPAKGASVRGRVYGVDGNPLPRVPVTLTMKDRVGTKCLVAEYRAGQVFTDDTGHFSLDFVLADVPFTVSAVDTSRMTDDDARAILGLLMEVGGEQGASRQRLEELAQEPNTRDAMLRAFQLGEVSQAIAAAEGLDRAVYSDFIPQGSGRDGSELAVALRFRGRGSVTGRVLTSAGAPIPGAAVNLFPDSESRELGRGMFTDSTGGFTFHGVPLGEFSLKAESPDGRVRMIADRLLITGELKSYDLALPDQPERYGAIRGIALEPEGTPHPGARVLVARQIQGSLAKEVVAQTTADTDGFFRFPRIPSGAWEVAVVSADGRRRGIRRDVFLADNAEPQLLIALEGTATIQGIVRYWDGSPAANAKVGGGDRVVRTDANGRFVLPGVPLGRRTLVAGVDARDSRDGVTRIGSLETTAFPTGNDLVTLRLQALGRIQGVVYNGTGTERVPNVRVAIPAAGGFFHVNANTRGEYEFNAFGLGSYVVSAPAPPVKKNPEQLAAEALDAIGQARASGNADEAAALVGELAQLYVQGSTARFSAPEFTPGAWGFNTAELEFDGQTVTADIRFLPSASLRGTVVNHQEVPIGAEVSVRAFGPSKTGGPSIKNLGPFPSDPSSGAWSAGGFLIGPFTAEAKSPLLAGTATVSGILEAQQPALTNLLLRFPPQRDLTGRLTGRIFDPDGQTVPNAEVQISFAPDYIIRTDTNGFFDTQIRLPEGIYVLTATNLDNGLVGQTQLQLVGGITNFAVVPLLGRGTLEVRVLDASGNPSPNTQVFLQRFQFPTDSTLELSTDASGRVVFEGLWEGDWQVRGERLVGANKALGTANGSVVRDVVSSLVLQLGPVTTVRGLFLEAATGLPIPGAQITAHFRGLSGPVYASAPTDPEGHFILTGIPVGTYVLVGRHPVSGRIAFQEVRLSSPTEIPPVTLVERSLGSLHGTVYSADGSQPVPGTAVAYSGPDQLSPARTVTTDPSGAFRFDAVPIGPFRLVASEPVLGLSTSISSELTAANSPLELDLSLPGLGTAEIQVLEADGVTVATQALVTVSGPKGPRSADTDTQGMVRFPELPLGSLKVSAQSRRVGQLNSVASGTLNLSLPNQARQLTLRLSGVAHLTGTLRDASDRAAANAAIEWRDAQSRVRRSVTGPDGRFSLDDLPLGAWQLNAALGNLAASASGSFTEADQVTELSLRLGASGTLTGTVLRENGAALHEAEVAFFFQSQNGQPGFARASTDVFGVFTAPGLPINTPISVRIDLPSLGGRASASTRLTQPNQSLDLGVLRLDQTPPSLLSIDPADGTVDVPPQPPITLSLSEPIRPESLRPEGILLNLGTSNVPIHLELAHGPSGSNSQIRIQPQQPLLSARTYTLFVAGGDRVDSTGRPVLLGPEDREGRPLPTTVTSSFTVRDSEPPVIVSQFPSSNAAGVEPEAPIRIEFNEPILTNRLELIVRSTTATIPGVLSFNPNQRLVVWAPLLPFDANTSYTADLRGITDRAQNQAPLHTFSFRTLDTLGPRITHLRLAPGQRPVANATVTLEALVAEDEPGAAVRFARNGTDIGLATQGPTFRWPLRLPAEGTVRVTAIAVDALGNPGEVALLELRVGPNDPPNITLNRIEPPSDSVETGRRFSFSATANDDATISAIRLTARGSLQLTREVFLPPNGSPTPFVFELPSDFVAGGQIEFEAVALDDSGATSEPALLQYTTVDATPPYLALEAPSDQTPLDPRQPLTLSVTARDNSARARLITEMSGVITETRETALTLTPNADLQIPLTLSLTNGLQGGTLRLQMRLLDEAGNEFNLRRTYTLRGVIGPRLQSITAVDLGASWNLPTTQTLSPWINRVSFHFDRALSVRPNDTDRLLVTNSAGIALSFTPQVTSSGAGVEFTGPALPPGSTVTIRLLPGLTDAQGNAALLADGNNIPAAGIEARFSVSSLGDFSLLQGTPAVPGQTLQVHLTHQVPFPFWRLQLNDLEPIPAQPTATGSLFRLTLPTNALQASIHLRSAAPNRPPIEIPPVDLDLRSRAADDDRDGIPNGWEADFGWEGRIARLNPFDPSDADNDSDADRLSHRMEFERGTHPFLADTDGDGLADGLESTPGSCPDPLTRDTDGDGIRDGDDPAPCQAGEALVLSPTAIQVPEGVTQTNLISVSGVGLNPLSLDFAPGIPKPSFLEFADFGATGTNPISRRLRIRPSFEDAGEHWVTFTVWARRNVTTITSNLVLKLQVEDRANTRFTRWARAQSGDWNQPTNWTAGVPGVGTNAIIDLPGTYTVSIASTVFIESLSIAAPSGLQSLQLVGTTLTLNGPSTLGPRSHLVLERSATLAGQGSVSTQGRVTVASGTLDGTGLLTVLPDAVLDFPGDGSGRVATLSRPVANEGQVRIGTNVTLNVSNVALTNRPTGRWTLDSGNLRWGAGTPRLENQGEFIKHGTNTSSLYFLAFHQRGTLRIEGGQLSLESAPFWFADGSTNVGSGSLRLSGSRGLVESPLAFHQPLVLNASALTNQAVQAWNRLEMVGATLDGQGPISIAENWTGRAATLLGTGPFSLRPTAEAALSSFGQIGKPFDSAGVLRLEPNTTIQIDGTRLLNRGTLEVPDTATLRWGNAFGLGSIENQGTIRKHGSGTLWVLGIALQNLGRVEVQEGLLRWDHTGENAGHIEVAAGAAAEWGATWIHAPTSWMGGEGRIAFNGGTHDLLGSVQPRGGLTVSSGDVTFRNTFDRIFPATVSGGIARFLAPQEFSSLTLRNGEITGSAPIRVQERLDWLNGVLSLGAPMVLLTNASSRIQNGTLGTDLENLGEVEVPPNAFLRFQGGSLLNRGELKIAGVATFARQGAANGLLRNEGLLRTGTNDVTFSVPVDWRGTQALSAIQLRLGPGTNHSTLHIPAGGRILFQTDFVHTPDSFLGGDGAIDFTGGSNEVAGTFQPGGDLLISGGDVHIRRAFSHLRRLTLRTRSLNLDASASLRDLAFEGGNLAAAETVSVSRSLSWSAGRLTGPGTLRTEPTAQVRISGFADKAVSGILETHGDVQIADNTRLYLGGGTWNIPANATNLLLGNIQVWRLPGSPQGQVSLAGSLEKSGPGVFDLDGDLHLLGSLSILSGSADLSGTTRLAGWLNLPDPAELRLTGATNVWSSGLRFEGAGTLRLPANRAVVTLESPVDLKGLNLVLENGARFLGEFPLSSGPSGAITFRAGTSDLEGTLNIAGRLAVGPNATLRVDDLLELGPGATLDNQGRRDSQNRGNIRVRVLRDQGGTILGIPPEVVPGVSPLQIQPRFPGQPSQGPQLADHRPDPIPAPRLILKGFPDLHDSLAVEYSQDLRHWFPLDLSPESYARPEGSLELPWPTPTDPTGHSPATLFFRLRELAW